MNINTVLFMLPQSLQDGGIRGTWAAILSCYWICLKKVPDTVLRMPPGEQPCSPCVT